MNRFVLGVASGFLFFTNEGQQMVDKSAKICIKTADYLLKNKLNIDIKEIITEETKKIECEELNNGN